MDSDPDVKRGLLAVDGARSVYIVPRHNVVDELLVPAMAAATEMSCMAGFFSSTAFGTLAPGLVPFINETDATMRLLVSPKLQEHDREILERVADDADGILAGFSRVVADARLSESALARHTHECLAYLMASRRLELRIVLVKRGMFHPKVWILGDGQRRIALHGSSNPTESGLLWNYETVKLERSWRSDDSLETIEILSGEFESIWNNTNPTTLTLDVSTAIKAELLEWVPSEAPTIDEFWEAWRQDAAKGLVPALPESPPESLAVDPRQTRLEIPSYLNYSTGKWAHQLRSIEAWESAERRGILALATGAGKTVAALVAAARMQSEVGPMLIVVAAPYRPLVAQWLDEVQTFGPKPLPLGSLSTQDMVGRLDEAIHALSLGVSEVEVAVVTQNFVSDSRFRALMSRVPADVHSLLIADEVHNLGRLSFIDDPPAFDSRLGLSATPERQYDPDGTERLFDYFGPPVHEFGLKEALGVCLVPYRYFVHPVALSGDELSEYEELTEKLIRAGFHASDSEPGESSRLSAEVTRLLVKRRSVIELADAKLGALRHALREQGEITHTLIYASDKGPRQLEDVNRMLSNDFGILYHQLTQEETGSAIRTAAILNAFTEGELKAITCKRVLDEGVNIPEVSTAYLLASSTVRRQWIQRRGRILRMTSGASKPSADLHDFVVVPEDLSIPSAKTILRSEFERVREFAELSSNAGAADGAYEAMEILKQALDEATGY